ncbi:MAG: lipoyl synthase [Bacteroidota bacterium]
MAAPPPTRPGGHAPRPPWLKVRLPSGENYARLTSLMERKGLHTVCREARCPNMGECWDSGTATFMILGDVCTRSCGFCAVKTGRPGEVDAEEPRRVAEAVRLMGVRYAVVTSVTRDDLPDGGAGLFAKTIGEIRRLNPGVRIEVLIPDFRGSEAALETVAAARPDVLNHNVETVPRLYPSVRPRARYERSLEVLAMASRRGMAAKSGLMLGLGETREEVVDVLRDLRGAGCSLVTLGQYLQPTKAHLPVERFLSPGEFRALGETALEMGFAHAASGPLVRSSYHAERQADAHPGGPAGG